MDPKELFFLDKKVIKMDRIISVLFSIAVVVLLLLIEKGYVETLGFSYPVFWLTSSVFIVMGMYRLFWNPYTRNKVLVYNLSYAVSGALISFYITGFSYSLVFLAWLMLIINTSIFFNNFVWYVIYGIFALSSTAWTLKYLPELSSGEVINIAYSTIFVGLICVFISSAWDLLIRSVIKLNNSRESEKLVSERLGSLINSMVDGVIATDETGRIALYNGAALNILNLNIDLHGKTFGSAGKFIDNKNREVYMDKFIQDTKSQVVNRDFKLKYSDGSLINLYISVAPVHLGFGRTGSEGFVILFRDITREKSLEEERDEFISVVSHELRTPIAIAEGEVGNAEYLVDKSGSDPKTKEALKQAHDQILFLSNMINDLATLSRAERGKLKVEIEDLDCAVLIKELEVDYRKEAEDKGLKLEVELDPSITALKSSKLYVREILQNFITNAIKYTEKGSVTISAKPYSEGILFKVIDTGIGISKGDQEKVFDKFFRSENYKTRETSGTGLGLYVTLKLAKRINADIELKSELNKGSTFSIRIPHLNQA